MSAQEPRVELAIPGKYIPQFVQEDRHLHEDIYTVKAGGNPVRCAICLNYVPITNFGCASNEVRQHTSLVIFFEVLWLLGAGVASGRGQEG